MQQGAAGKGGPRIATAFLELHNGIGADTKQFGAFAGASGKLGCLHFDNPPLKLDASHTGNLDETLR